MIVCCLSGKKFPTPKTKQWKNVSGRIASLKFVGTPFVLIMPGEIIVEITYQDKCSYKIHFEEFSGLNLIISMLPCEEQTTACRTHHVGKS